MPSVSDDDVRKSLLEKPRFEPAAKGVFRLGRCYIFRQDFPGLWASDRESIVDRLTGGTRRRLVPVERSQEDGGPWSMQECSSCRVANYRRRDRRPSG